MPGTFLFTFPTAASPSSTSLTLLLGFGALSAIVLEGRRRRPRECPVRCGLRCAGYKSVVEIASGSAKREGVSGKLKCDVAEAFLEIPRLTGWSGI